MKKLVTLVTLMFVLVGCGSKTVTTSPAEIGKAVEGNALSYEIISIEADKGLKPTSAPSDKLEYPIKEDGKVWVSVKAKVTNNTKDELDSKTDILGTLKVGSEVIKTTTFFEISNQEKFSQFERLQPKADAVIQFAAQVPTDVLNQELTFDVNVKETLAISNTFKVAQ
ncbi:hypothetical protein [Erysipelothrix anatis]|uniref:hypothetical protein n=1 Tax=Erysipelothrix anatis TaxID=2683713 RepID=UPI00135ABBB8|nr:hypothetical protein [Erysipelothrix anatis]